MKLSNETISVLKNFSTINQNLMVKAGSVFHHVCNEEHCSKGRGTEELPSDVAIYDLNEFLSALSLFGNQI